MLVFGSVHVYHALEDILSVLQDVIPRMASQLRLLYAISIYQEFCQFLLQYLLGPLSPRHSPVVKSSLYNMTLLQRDVRLDLMFVNQTFHNPLDNDTGRDTKERESKLIFEVSVNVRKDKMETGSIMSEFAGTCLGASESP